VLNSDEQEALVHQYHSSLIGCHAGVGSTLSRLRRHFFWPRMKEMISKIIKICPDCQLNKRTIKKAIPLKITTNSDSAFEYVAIDIMQRKLVSS
jgi:Integrase zinc binding domain